MNAPVAHKPWLFQKGMQKVPGSGRKPGIKNTVPRDIRAEIIKLWDDMGGADGVYNWLQCNEYPEVTERQRIEKRRELSTRYMFFLEKFVKLAIPKADVVVNNNNNTNNNLFVGTNGQPVAGIGIDITVVDPNPEQQKINRQHLLDNPQTRHLVLGEGVAVEDAEYEIIDPPER